MTKGRLCSCGRKLRWCLERMTYRHQRINLLPYLCQEFPMSSWSKDNFFKKMLEAAKKDTEQAFGVLQSRWAIIRGPRRFWYKTNLKEFMYVCIILHNMIVKHEGELTFDWSDDSNNHNNINIDLCIIQGSVEVFN